MGFTMTDTVHIPRTLAKRLEKVAAQSRRKPGDIVKSALKDQLDYEEWFLKEIDKGVAELDRGEAVSHGEAMATLDEILQKHARKKKQAA